MRFLIAAVALAALATSATAQNCDGLAQQSSFGTLDIGRVKAGIAKVLFQADCAGVGPNSCLSTAYVVPGDVVLFGKAVEESVCAAYVDAKGRTTTGLLARERLEPPVPQLLNLPVELLGTWRRTEARIEIKRKGADGMMSFAGDATYGSFDKGRVARGAVNIGEFAFDKKPLTNAVSSPTPKDSACHVAMLALGPYLVVEDNRMCGGVNVSFTGVYRRGK